MKAMVSPLPFFFKIEFAFLIGVGWCVYKLHQILGIETLVSLSTKAKYAKAKSPSHSNKCILLYTHPGLDQIPENYGFSKFLLAPP